MKKIYKNLLLPVALITMAIVGAFTVNAGNMMMDKQQSIEIEKQAQTPYYGAVYYHDGTNWVLLSSTSDGGCTLNITIRKCEQEIEGVIRQMYGENPISGDKQMLFQRTE